LRSSSIKKKIEVVFHFQKDWGHLPFSKILRSSSIFHLVGLKWCCIPKISFLGCLEQWWWWFCYWLRYHLNRSCFKLFWVVGWVVAIIGDLNIVQTFVICMSRIWTCKFGSDMQKVKKVLLADILVCIFRRKVHDSQHIHVRKGWNSVQMSKNTLKKTSFTMNWIIYIVRRKLWSPPRSICQISINFLCFPPIALQNNEILLTNFRQC
jgi:hypothetical protein